MKRYLFPDTRPWKAAFYAFLTALLFLARDSMFTTAVIGFYKAQFLMLGLIALAGVAFLVVNRRRMKEIFMDPRLLLMAGAALVCLLPMAVKGDWQLMYFSVLLCLLVGIFMSYFTTVAQVAKCYVCILTVLGVYSILATYVLRMGVDSGLYRVPVFKNGADAEFHNFFLAVVSDSFVKNRNFGIFREPGVYQFFLALGLYLNNDRVEWEKPWQMWAVNLCLGATMLSTFATGGFVELGLLAVVLCVEKKWYRSKWLWILVAALGGCVTVMALYCISQKNILYWEVYDMLVGKFSGDTDSMTDRFQSIFVNLGFFLESPVVGRPLGMVLYAVENNTSSTMILLGGFGFLAGALNLVSWGALVWKKQRHALYNLCYLGILFMAFNTQNLIGDVFLWLLPMMALTERVLTRKGEVHGS